MLAVRKSMEGSTRAGCPPSECVAAMKHRQIFMVEGSCSERETPERINSPPGSFYSTVNASQSHRLRLTGAVSRRALSWRWRRSEARVASAAPDPLPGPSSCGVGVLAPVRASIGAAVVAAVDVSRARPGRSRILFGAVAASAQPVLRPLVHGSDRHARIRRRSGVSSSRRTWPREELAVVHQLCERGGNGDGVRRVTMLALCARRDGHPPDPVSASLGVGGFAPGQARLDPATTGGVGLLQRLSSRAIGVESRRNTGAQGGPARSDLRRVPQARGSSTLRPIGSTSRAIAACAWLGPPRIRAAWGRRQSDEWQSRSGSAEAVALPAPAHEQVAPSVIPEAAIVAR